MTYLATREESIRTLAFFEDKQQLADQIISIEERTQKYLPNQFSIKQIPPYEIGDRKVAMGRIHEFYYLGMMKADEPWKYQGFESTSKFKEFFINLPEMDQKELAFWFNNIELLENK